MDSTHFILKKELQSGEGKSLAQRVKDEDEPTPGGLTLMSDHMLILLCNLTGNHRACLVPACCFRGSWSSQRFRHSHETMRVEASVGLDFWFPLLIHISSPFLTV